MKRECTNQGDFGLWFHTSNYEPIYYPLRNDHNKFHDIIYLASYIHDATFFPSDIQNEGKEIVLNMDRIRWELYKDANALEGINSQLIFKNVKNFSITYKNTFKLRKKAIEIKDFYLCDGTFHITTAFEVCEIKIAMPSRASIVLKDKIS